MLHQEGVIVQLEYDVCPAQLSLIKSGRVIIIIIIIQQVACTAHNMTGL